MTRRLAEELRQKKPFPSLEEEVLLGLARTADAVLRPLAEVLKAQGLSPAQYNVLRILRGAGDAGLPTLAIRDRMVEEAAGITRLLDKLESAGYVVRERSTPDRRQVLCHITPKGESLITSLDAPMDAANQRAGSNLDDHERREIVELLGAIRAAYTNSRPVEHTQGSMRAAQPPR